jgi:hypothetical protein
MFKTAFYRASYAVVTLPYFALAILAISLKFKIILTDALLCVEAVNEITDEQKLLVSADYLQALIAAEDHRNLYHFGVDPIAIIRGLYATTIQGNRQGASTIEQQFVRTITGRYEKTPRRKIREQVLALIIASVKSKKDISIAYACVAYYGTEHIGIKSGQKMVLPSNHNLDIKLIACLKYPKPIHISARFLIKHSTRCAHINRLLSGSRQKSSSEEWLAHFQKRQIDNSK